MIVYMNLKYDLHLLSVVCFKLNICKNKYFPNMLDGLNEFLFVAVFFKKCNIKYDVFLNDTSPSPSTRYPRKEGYSEKEDDF